MKLYQLFIAIYLNIYSILSIWPFNSNTNTNTTTLNDKQSDNSTSIKLPPTTSKHWLSFPDLFQHKVNPNALATELLIQQSKRYARYAGASYCKDINTIKTWNCTLYCQHEDTQSTQILGIFENKTYKTRGYVAVNHYLKEIIISFRGSNKWRNFLSDLKVFKLDYELPYATKNVKIHRGFMHCTNSLKPYVIRYLNQALKALPSKDYNIVITGHSLGGSIAVLTSLYLKEELKISTNRLRVYTYGQPRIGNQAFANLVNNSTIPILRIINRSDPIPHMPPSLLGFTHHDQEIYIANPTTTLTCNMDKLKFKDDPNCSASRSLLLNINMHLKVWNIQMGTYC